MPSTFAELNCGEGEVVRLERTADGKYIFHDFDIETELAAHELGFKPSLCWFLWQTYETSGSLEGAMSSLAEAGDYDTVYMLLELGEPPRPSALRAASAGNHTEIMLKLIAAGADPYIALTELLLRPSTAHEEALDILFAAVQGDKSA